MSATPTCPRCLLPLSPPDVWSSQWRCDVHGETTPYRVARSSRRRVLEVLTRTSNVPVWVPWPMPVSWFASGVSWAGDDRSGPTAAVFASSGPSPLGGFADLAVVAESPGIGLGARLAGLDGVEPSRIGGPPESKVEAAGHPTALWPVECPDDRAAFVGEARGVWLWIVLWPAAAAVLLLEDLVLRDLRDEPVIADLLTFGVDSDRLGVDSTPPER